MESLRYVESYYDDEDRDEVYNSSSSHLRYFRDEQSASGENSSTGTSALLPESTRDTDTDASRGSRQHPFCFTDVNALLYEKKYYDDEDDHITQSNYFSRFYCQDHCQKEHSTNINYLLPGSGSGADPDASKGSRKHHFRLTDMHVLSHKEEFYGEEDVDVAQSRNVSGFGYQDHCTELDSQIVNYSEDRASTTNEEIDLSAVMERVLNNIRSKSGETQSSVLNEDIDPHDTQFGEENACLKKISLLTRNLNRIMRNFEKCQESWDRFHEMYPVWNSNTRRVMAELKEIADALDKTRLDCNIQRIIAAAGGTVGGVLSVAGAALLPFTVGLSAPLMISGCTITLTGGSAALGTSVAEVIILKQKVEVVQSLLKCNMDKFLSMSQLFDHATDYIDSINEIMDFDVFAELIKDFSRLFSVLGKTGKENAIGRVLVSLFQSHLKNLPQPIAIAISIAKSRKLPELLKELFVMHHHNHVVFESVAMTSRILLEIGKTVGDIPGADVVTTVTGIAKVGAATARASMRKALSQGAFAAVGLAIDVTSLILTSIDIHKGSKCPKAQEIREISEKLSNEFDLVKRIYVELAKCKQAVPFST